MSSPDASFDAANSPIATGADRRTSEREFPRRTSVRLLLSGTWREFQVLDESEGGLGIFSGSTDELQKGSIVDAYCEFAGQRRAAIRYIAPHPRGGFHVGLMWES